MAWFTERVAANVLLRAEGQDGGEPFAGGELRVFLPFRQLWVYYPTLTAARREMETLVTRIEQHPERAKEIVLCWYKEA